MAYDYTVLTYLPDVLYAQHYKYKHKISGR